MEAAATDIDYCFVSRNNSRGQRQPRPQQRLRAQSEPTSPRKRRALVESRGCESSTGDRESCHSSRLKANASKLRHKRRKKGRGEVPPKLKNVDSIWRALNLLTSEDLTKDNLRAILEAPQFRKLPDV